MYRIIDGRGTGKTKKLMNIALKENAVFVCNNPSSMNEKANAYGIYGLRFVSYFDFINGTRGAQDGKYCIDNLDDFARFCVTALRVNSAGNQCKMVGYTLSDDD